MALEVQNPKTRKKLPNYQDEPLRIGGWTPISTWINPPHLGRNCIHCVEFPHQMRKLLLNLAPNEPLSLVQDMHYFDNPIKLDPLLVSSLDLCVHDLTSVCFFYVVRVKIFWFQFFCYL
jgi:hypothetical protein